jgi:hypothetical protein
MDRLTFVPRERAGVGLWGTLGADPTVVRMWTIPESSAAMGPYSDTQGACALSKIQ